VEEQRGERPLLPDGDFRASTFELTRSKKQQLLMLMERFPLDRGRRPIQLHVRCNQIWDHERHAA
jgi:hypothetical protein